MRQKGSTMTCGQQSLSKARKMYLLDERGGIFRNDHFRKSSTNGPSQTSRNSGMACVKNVRSFLRFGNYYRRFIHDYGNITKPLNDLLGKNKTFEWSQECQDTFELLKRKFQESPVLLMPDMTKPFVVESDASKYASGAVLRQQDNNGDWHPCAYLSKSFC